MLYYRLMFPNNCWLTFSELSTMVIKKSKLIRSCFRSTYFWAPAKLAWQAYSHTTLLHSLSPSRSTVPQLFLKRCVRCRGSSSFYDRFNSLRPQTESWARALWLNAGFVYIRWKVSGIFSGWYVGYFGEKYVILEIFSFCGYFVFHFSFVISVSVLCLVTGSYLCKNLCSNLRKKDYVPINQAKTSISVKMF